MLSAKLVVNESSNTKDSMRPESKYVVTCVDSTKGGNRKTTFSCRLADTIADRGFRTLIADAGPPQSARAAYLNQEPIAHGGRLPFVPTSLPAEQCITRTRIDNLSVNLGNDLDPHLSSWIKKPTTMKATVATPPHWNDCTFIDTQGSDRSGDTQQLAQRSAHTIVCPIEPDGRVTRKSTNNGVEVLKRLYPTDHCNQIPARPGLTYTYKPNSSVHTAYREGFGDILADFF